MSNIKKDPITGMEMLPRTKEEWEHGAVERLERYLDEQVKKIFIHVQGTYGKLGDHSPAVSPTAQVVLILEMLDRVYSPIIVSRAYSVAKGNRKEEE